MTKLGSHNTMTYLPVKQWYLKPFWWMARCQSKDIKEQSKYTNFFDIRVRFDKDDNPVFAHGLIEYKFDYKVFDYINTLITTETRVINGEKTIVPTAPIVMLSLEWNKKKHIDKQKLLFLKLCKELEEKYRYIDFCGGAIKYNWHTVYHFMNPLPDYVQYVSSTTGSKIDDIWPWLFAIIHNHKALNYGRKHDYVNVDYIHYINND